MATIIKQSPFQSISPHDYQRILKFRYKVFKQRLGWELDTYNDCEQDDYDNENAHYIYAEDDNQEVVACCRLIPTQCRYMLRDTFPALLGDSVAPSSAKIFEISRVAVQKNSSRIQTKASELTIKLSQAAYYYAVENGIDEYVTVTSTGIERLHRKLGTDFERIGDCKEHLLGNTKSVVLSIRVTEKTRLALSF